MRSDKIRTFNNAKSIFKEQLEGISRKRKLGYFFSLYTASNEEEKAEFGDQTATKMTSDLRLVLNHCDDLLEELPSILRHVRNICPRLHFFSNAQVIDLLTTERTVKEITLQMLWGFPMIKTLDMVGSDESFFIEGFKTKDEQNVKVLNPIGIEREEDRSNFFILNYINEFEKEVKLSVRANFTSNFGLIIENPYDYVINFKFLQPTSRKLLFQVLKLVIDIQFYHDLTMIIICTEKEEERLKGAYLTDKMKILKACLEENLRKFLDNIDLDKTDKSKYMHFAQYVSQIKHQIDIIKYIMDSNVLSLDSFEYLILPKPMIEYLMKTVETKDKYIFDDTVVNVKNYLDTILTTHEFGLTGNWSSYLHFFEKIDYHHFDVIIRAFNYRKAYGYELTPCQNILVYTPTTDRCFVSMIGALATKTGSLINGAQHIGKSETIKV